MTRPAVLLLSLALVAGACGDDDATTTTRAVTTTAQESTTVATTPSAQPTFAPDRMTAERAARDADLARTRMETYLTSLAATRPITFRPDRGCVYRSHEVVVRSDLVDGLLEPNVVVASGLPGIRGPELQYSILVLADGTDALDYSETKAGVHPHYVLPLSQEYKWGPGTSALPTEGDSGVDYSPPTYDPEARVLVFDTAPNGPFDVDKDGFLAPVAGHGDFVSWIISRPVADLDGDGEVDDQLGVWLIDPRADDGVLDLQSFDQAVDDALTAGVFGNPPYAINLSFGGPECTTEMPGQAEPRSLLETLDKLLGYAGDGSVIVASAGNDKTPEPYYPAAYAGDRPNSIVSVGALDEAGATAAAFSNCGTWVIAWATGAGIVGPYPKGEEIRYAEAGAILRYEQGGQRVEQTLTGPVTATSQGIVEWSGTSFAAPVVTRAVAAVMVMSGKTPREAWEDVKADWIPSSAPWIVDASGHCSPAS